MISKKILSVLLFVFLLESFHNISDIEQAKTMYKQHNYTGAVKILKDIVKHSPCDIEALDYMGHCYRETGDYKTAYTFIDSSIACGNTSYEVFVNSGDLAFKLDKRMEAFNSLMIAYRKDSVGLNVNYNLGLLYWLKFDLPNKALVHFYKELAAYPQHADAFAAIGQVYLNIDSIDSSICYYNKALSIDSNDYNLYYHRGIMWCSIGDWNKAIEDFTKSHSVNPEFSDATFYRGVAYLQIGNLKRACDDFSRIKDTKYPQNIDSLMQIYCK